MLKMDVLQRIRKEGMVAIVREGAEAHALAVAEACIDGGVAALEIALTTPGALRIIETLRKLHGEDVLLGAGTVLDPETARVAILSGAQFIISPTVNQDVIRLCNRYQVASLPGAMTPTEIITAMEAGADIIKVFPSETMGPAYIKALQGPLPHAPLMPTGGVTLDNLGEWFRHGSVAVGIGSSLTGTAKSGDYAAIAANARGFVQRMVEISLQSGRPSSVSEGAMPLRYRNLVTPNEELSG